jgi:GxxExxY protein
MANGEDSDHTPTGAVAPIGADLDRVATVIVDAGLKVHRTLGPGLLETVYEQCLAHELSERGLAVRRQLPVPITYGRLKIDVAYRMDMLVEGVVVVEVKAVEVLTNTHHAQLLTYLKLADLRLGLLMNFNVPLFKQGVKRVAR